MSYRHPLRQTQTVDYSSTKRQPSNASTISTAYSNSSGAFELSRTSTLSSTASSGYAGHKRGLSEAIGMSYSAAENWSGRSSHDGSPNTSPYKNVRQSLRPLPQAPAPSPPSGDSDGFHSRGQSMDGIKGPYTDSYPSISTARTSTIRPNSMILSRADSISRGARSQTMQHPHSQFAAPDLQSLQRSSTSQLRTLSKFA